MKQCHLYKKEVYILNIILISKYLIILIQLFLDFHSSI